MQESLIEENQSKRLNNCARKNGNEEKGEAHQAEQMTVCQIFSRTITHLSSVKPSNPFMYLSSLYFWYNYLSSIILSQHQKVTQKYKMCLKSVSKLSKKHLCYSGVKLPPLNNFTFEITSLLNSFSLPYISTKLPICTNILIYPYFIVKSCFWTLFILMELSTLNTTMSPPPNFKMVNFCYILN